MLASVCISSQRTHDKSNTQYYIKVQNHVKKIASVQWWLQVIYACHQETVMLCTPPSRIRLARPSSVTVILPTATPSTTTLCPATYGKPTFPVVPAGVSSPTTYPLLTICQRALKRPSPVTKPPSTVFKSPNCGSKTHCLPAGALTRRPSTYSVRVLVGPELQPCAWLT